MTTYTKKGASQQEIDILRALADKVGAGERTCTTYLIRVDPPRDAVMAYVGESIEKYTARKDALPIDWDNVKAAIRCAANALADIGWVHADLTSGAARNIARSGTTYSIIDFDKMDELDDDFDIDEFVDDTMASLVSWLVRYRNDANYDFVKRTFTVDTYRELENYLESDLFQPDRKRLFRRLQSDVTTASITAALARLDVDDVDVADFVRE